LTDELVKLFLKYVSGGRDTNVELNALKEFQREFLEDLIKESIRQHVDLDVKRHVEARIRERRATIRNSLTFG
jgi:hypothetical protein